MKKLLCNSLIASVVVVAGATTSTSQANAQSADVDFSGDVANTCQVTKVKDGTLGFNSNPTIGLGAKPDQYPGGELAEVSVNCNGSGTISITPVSAVSAPATALANKSGFSSGASIVSDTSATNDTIITDTSRPPGTITPNSDGTPQSVYIHMWARDMTNGGTLVAPGNYVFRTTVSVTPQ